MGESVGLGQSHLILGTKTILDPKLTLYCLGTQSRDTLLILSWSFAPPMKSKRSSPAKVPRTSLRLSSRDPWRTHHPTHCPIAGSISQYFTKKTLLWKDFPFLTCCSDGFPSGERATRRDAYYPCATTHVKRVCLVRRKCQQWLRDITGQMSLQGLFHTLSDYDNPN